jgi:hypothetical protein
MRFDRNTGDLLITLKAAPRLSWGTRPVHVHSSTLKRDESQRPSRVQQAEQVRVFREAWKAAGHVQRVARAAQPPLALTGAAACETTGQATCPVWGALMDERI